MGYTDGCGILKSTNGGDSWTRVAASILAPAGQLGGFVYHVSIDRATAGSATGTTLFAATNLGLIRSTNSGASWSNVLQGFATDVVQHPTRPEVWYAAIGNLFGAAANGVYISTNGGTTWASHLPVARHPVLARPHGAGGEPRTTGIGLGHRRQPVQPRLPHPRALG